MQFLLNNILYHVGMYKTMLIIPFICLCVTMLCSCNIVKSGKLKKEELLKYIQDVENGLVKTQEANGVKVEVSFFPSSLLVAQELEGQQKTDTAIENKFDKQYYFKVKFSKDGKEAIRQLGGFNRYSEMVQVLAFRMDQYVNLTTPLKDTVALSGFFFDQTYGMSNANTVLLCFPKDGFKSKSDVLSINIGECGFGTGTLKFEFKKEDINNTPELVYDTNNINDKKTN